jgi:hypothetical protein
MVNEKNLMEGGCLCGAIRYRIGKSPVRTTHCHCLHCRRSSGAPFLTWVGVVASEFSIVFGTPSQYESRPGATRQFCGKCGTQLTFYNVDEPEVIDVTACSLDDADGIEPEDHIWCDRMVPWLQFADRLPRYKLRRSDGQ